jgi:citrate lyase subunit beta/citryl-CoA lyase
MPRARGLWSFGVMRSIADLGDPAALAAAAAQARRLGLDGATCVHPDAVPIQNAGFLPPLDKIAWATRVIAAAEGRSSAFSSARAGPGQLSPRPKCSNATPTDRRP